MNVPAMGTVVLNNTVSAWSFNAAPVLDIWFIVNSAAAVGTAAVWNERLSGYVSATGHSPVWPAWASGFWQVSDPHLIIRT